MRNQNYRQFPTHSYSRPSENTPKIPHTSPYNARASLDNNKDPYRDRAAQANSRGANLAWSSTPNASQVFSVPLQSPSAMPRATKVQASPQEADQFFSAASVQLPRAMLSSRIALLLMIASLVTACTHQENTENNNPPSATATAVNPCDSNWISYGSSYCNQPSLREEEIQKNLLQAMLEMTTGNDSPEIIASLKEKSGTIDDETAAKIKVAIGQERLGLLEDRLSEAGMFTGDPFGVSLGVEVEDGRQVPILRILFRDMQEGPGVMERKYFPESPRDASTTQKRSLSSFTPTQIKAFINNKVLSYFGGAVERRESGHQNYFMSVIKKALGEEAFKGITTYMKDNNTKVVSFEAPKGNTAVITFTNGKTESFSICNTSTEKDIANSEFVRYLNNCY
ncbi:hypothetical protein HZA38_03885 [Candidatus Peregrinibacteria bacterium]|nr:hypothetical protein [Candidatus Peregrinibacteria bacterium]